MIFTWLIAPLLSFFTGILGVLPTGTWDPSLNGAGAASDFGTYFAAAQSYVDVALLVDLLDIVILFVAPAVLVYAIAQWGYRELPDLWGFGPS